MLKDSQHTEHSNLSSPLFFKEISSSDDSEAAEMAFDFDESCLRPRAPEMAFEATVHIVNRWNWLKERYFSPVKDKSQNTNQM